MPIYEYECLTCGDVFEKRQSFNDEPKANCPNGHTETRRLIAAPAIVFKGSGFYINDSRNGKSGTNGKADSTLENKTESNKAESKADSTSESKTETKTETKSESTSKAAADS